MSIWALLSMWVCSLGILISCLVHAGYLPLSVVPATRYLVYVGVGFLLYSYVPAVRHFLTSRRRRTQTGKET